MMMEFMIEDLTDSSGKTERKKRQDRGYRVQKWFSGLPAGHDAVF